MIKLKKLLTEGGTKAGQDVLNAITRGRPSRFGNFSNIHNWAAHLPKGLEFGLKRDTNMGGKNVKIIRITVVGKNKYNIEYLDWNKEGKRPLDLRKIQKGLKGEKLPIELKKNVKVYG